MYGYMSVKDKYEGEAIGKSFWLNTFKNAFTYTVDGTFLKLVIWDGQNGEFGNIDINESLKNVTIKNLNDGSECFRITLDNNANMYKRDKDSYVMIKPSMALGSNLLVKNNPLVIRIGSDNYIVYKLNIKDVKNPEKLKDDFVRCCVEMFGDANDRNEFEYYWNFEDGITDTYYERYTKSSSLIIRYSNEFKIAYEPHGCRVDKYKEEDASYVVDRYF